MPASTYYPSTNDGRADWWQNISSNSAALSALGLSAPQVSAIGADAGWGIYLYRTVRVTFEEYHSAVIAYCDEVLGEPAGAELPAAPAPPPWPTPPPFAVLTGIEKRRTQWVAQVKSNALYTTTLGELLRIEEGGTPFDPTTYQAVLLNVASPSAGTVAGKFRKASGQIDGINLYGRKEGASGWTGLGRFNATPFSAMVPLAGAAPEAWEFQARAVRRDVEIGTASLISQAIIRG